MERLFQYCVSDLLSEVKMTQWCCFDCDVEATSLLQLSKKSEKTDHFHKPFFRIFGKIGRTVFYVIRPDIHPQYRLAEENRKRYHHTTPFGAIQCKPAADDTFGREMFRTFAEDGQSASDSKCLICYTNDKNFVIDPCLHLAVCMDCAGLIEKCPICRKDFKQGVKIFNC
jgi:hypothetical protein